MKHMAKRILSLVFVLALLASTALLFSACGEDEQQLTFELNPDGQSYTCTGFVVKKDREVRVAELVIPETYEELPVTAIADSAFSETWAHVQGTLNSVGMGQDTSDYVSITSVVIPDSVTSIGDSAFQYCKSLKSAHLPDGLEELGENVFAGCESLETIGIPSKITELPKSTFVGCASLNCVALPSTMTTIGESAFQSCTSLASVDLPAGLTTIGAYAFQECTKLNGVILPEGFTTLGSDAYKDCEALTSLSLPDSLESWSRYDFAGCPLEYQIYEGCKYIGNWLISAVNKEELTTLKIKEGTVGIMDYALSGCEKLTGEVVIPNTVKFIGDHAFGGRTFQGKGSIHSISIPASVTHMGKGVFTDCGYNRSLYVGNTFSPKYFTINCKAAQKPEGWDDAWLSTEQYDVNYSKVNWGK